METLTISKKTFNSIISNAKDAAHRNGYTQYVYADADDNNTDTNISFSRIAHCMSIGNNVPLAMVETYWDCGILKTKTKKIYDTEKVNFV